MLKEGQLIKINPPNGGKNVKLLIDKGYQISADGCYYIEPSDLYPNSHLRVQVVCDGCGKEVGMEYRQYTHKSKQYENGKYYCKYCAAKTQEVKQKRINGMIEKYGVENAMFDDILKNKCMISCSHNHSVPTSKAQLEVFNIVSRHYQNVTLNYLENNHYLDCMLSDNDIKIDIEYDGWYWHQNTNKDNQRDSDLYQLGYKVLRIKGGKKPPQEDELLNAIKYLLTNNDNYYEIILSDYKEITN